MLKFAYTDCIDLDEHNAPRLLALADKYDFRLLKFSCEDFLYRILTKHNCAEFLHLAELYCADLLMKHALLFFSKHAKKVIQTPGWNVLKSSRLPLAIRVMESKIMKTDGTLPN